jgi:hypothetical protein
MSRSSMSAGFFTCFEDEDTNYIAAQHSILLNTVQVWCDLEHMSMKVRDTKLPRPKLVTHTCIDKILSRPSNWDTPPSGVIFEVD